MKEIETVEQIYDRIAPNMSKAWGKKDVAMMVAKVYAAQFQPQWIKINRESDLPDKSQTVLVWQYNLSDPKSSRLQKAEYFSGIFKIYPRLQNGYFEAVNDFKAYDLEGDMCQITHWMPISQSPKEDA